MTDTHPRSLKPRRSDPPSGPPLSPSLPQAVKVNDSELSSELLQQRLTEEEDNSAALKEQIAVYKELCKVLQEKLDTAQIDYAIAEGKLLEMTISKFNSQCRQCRLKDGMIGRLERDLEELQLDNIRLQERINQHERKRKHRVSQSQLGSYHSDDPVLSPTMESVPTRTPYQVPQAAASRGIVVKDEKILQQSALKCLLYKNDQLVEELASSFEQTCIQGRPGSWISLCHHLKIDSANLFHIEAKSRLLDILKEFEKSLDHDISISELCNIFREVGNENSACRLERFAQMHVVLDDKPHGRSHHKTPHRTKDQFNEEVSDSDFDSSSSEEWIIV